MEEQGITNNTGNEKLRSAWKDFLIRAIFVVTFVVIVAFGAWGGITIVKYIPGTFSRIGSNIYGNISAAAIEIGSLFVPADIRNGNVETGGLIVVDGSESNEIATDPEDGPESIAVAPEGESGTLPQVLTAGEETETTTTLDETPVFEDPNGTPDLSVAVSAVGILDPNTNEFVAQESMTRSNRGAVFFTVTNLGTKTALEGWVFRATIPTLPRHIYTSDPQQSLAPGDRIEFTLGFDSVSPDGDGNAITSIVVDPDEALDEITRENNTAKAVITVSSE